MLSETFNSNSKIYAEVTQFDEDLILRFGIIFKVIKSKSETKLDKF